MIDIQKLRQLQSDVLLQAVRMSVSQMEMSALQMRLLLATPQRIKVSASQAQRRKPPAGALQIRCHD